MAKVWHSIPAEFPEDQQEVWVRRLDFWDAFRAVWDEDPAEFVLAIGYRMPWYTVARWKVYTA